LAADKSLKVAPKLLLVYYVVIMNTLSRILDYLFVWSILIFIADLFDVSCIYMFGITLLLPILFIPVETLFIKCFKTTPGKFILSLRYKESFTWKSAFLLSCKTACFQKTSSVLIRKNPRFIFRLIVALFMFCTIFPETAVKQASKVLPFEIVKHLKVHRTGGVEVPIGWVKLGSTTLPFSAFFPSQATLTEMEKSIPHSDKTLLFKEYTSNEYSLVHVDLPNSWVKWGSNLVFKGTLQQVLSYENATLLNKQKTTYNDYPALDFTLKKGNKTSYGRLILVNNTIYKLESEAENEEQASYFFNTLQIN